MIELQNVILEMIAKGKTLERTAVRLCVEVERLLPGVVCSVMTVDGDDTLHPLAAPSLPDDYPRQFDGVAVGLDSGSCGAAAYLRTGVTTIDIATDPHWHRYRHLSLPLGLLACWSSPILNGLGDAIGTFTLYYRDRRGPSDAEQDVVAHCLHLSAIAIERHQRVVEHERRAFTDALTNLNNRAAFDAALRHLRCDVPGAWGLLVIDLDNLKIANDIFGHATGDCMLQIASKRISEAVHPDRAFRLGGDEFAVILQSPDALSDLAQTAERILAVLVRPADCGGNIVVPRGTIGGALVATDDPTPQQVHQNADFALYHAKESCRGAFVRFWPGLGTSITRRLTAIQDVDLALREGRIEAYYQPIVRLDTLEIVGLEALCRMRVDDRIVPAALFHEATTDVHIATELTARMMALVAADVRGWLDLGIPIQHVGINVSSADIHGRVDQVLEAAFHAHAVPLKHVILEVTESVYMGHGDHVTERAIKALRSKGLRVALDDFGTGFASLTHLLTVPVDIIKIDKSFVDRLHPGDGSMAIVEGLIRIAGQLNIRVVAEGIETEDQAQLLRSMGCVLGQGYLFSRAVDRTTITTLLLDCSQPAGNEPSLKKLLPSAERRD
ncbi:putative bifunctional diguanylate cyclase/phosphodiesterase [Sphingomonas prati]|uniref:Diguanylate cyclase (GGDEF)-like protein n=1 Tax=Sphingomonas prati TaxID=1843237 RepID=A0A7W9BRC8_9SPHN|nr:EAL domain-containing protein [Sphingomonas prati]MBB5728667.1 diguanylate cyclase (GGDEF)-like protein [Sphingomonas prati]GGE72026.1 hypothetical protein GCM10011404_00610 [Sphingomonas prati]